MERPPSELEEVRRQEAKWRRQRDIVSVFSMISWQGADRCPRELDRPDWAIREDPGVMGRAARALHLISLCLHKGASRCRLVGDSSVRVRAGHLEVS